MTWVWRAPAQQFLSGLAHGFDLILRQSGLDRFRRWLCRALLSGPRRRCVSQHGFDTPTDPAVVGSNRMMAAAFDQPDLICAGWAGSIMDEGASSDRFGMRLDLRVNIGPRRLRRSDP
jgi:hypothetical protein